MSLKSEIHEQPEILARLLRRQLAAAREIAAAIESRGVASAFLAARGTSDNAALYAKYLWGAFDAMPVGLATPSLFTAYGTPPRLEGSLVVGVSQSGESPDIVAVVAEGRRQGALTLAITNETSSPLAREAELVFDLMAGTETAVAATKTYTAQLLAVALIGAVLAGDEELVAELERVPDLVREALELDEPVRAAAERYRDMKHCVVLGRGFNYATAYEWALKLKEMTYVVAEPYSSGRLPPRPGRDRLRRFPGARRGSERRRVRRSSGAARDSGDAAPGGASRGVQQGRGACAGGGADSPSGGSARVAEPADRDRSRAALLLSPDPRAGPWTRRAREG